MHQKESKKDIVAKVLVIGEAKVGKTSILTRYTEGSFQESMIPTLGIDYRFKKLFVKGQEIKLQIWDTAGQERFRAITQNFYKGAMGIILVFDLTDPKTFKTLSNWIENIKQYSGSEACRILLGNKCDISQNQIPKQDIQNLANQNKIQYFETSAKSNEGIQQAFQQIADDIANKFFSELINIQSDQKLDLDNSLIRSPSSIKREEQQQALQLQVQKSPRKKTESESCCS
ncbi:Rab-family small GTPase (macronuclear) [Tetrahymena thermophila SB210]|uniref:Rab-family small GTPase n=2 Tax=Tetrahymena thermophila TaxID=5911 RepID=I7MHF3_TETTS|nr:Rab-family small GTPase [Tetrahymena thermophila SB210]EAR87481.1 Rab-family small GTPase [Tetrahymena thermophila SB210]BAJ21313.1 Rab-family small GTPase RabX5 [Tetrahymena thermophila]|eukprot:XP_001007726.1 Rab-family small GTPase [Tetrahymena thermophila SB210]